MVAARARFRHNMGGGGERREASAAGTAAASEVTRGRWRRRRRNRGRQQGHDVNTNAMQEAVERGRWFIQHSFVVGVGACLCSCLGFA